MAIVKFGPEFLVNTAKQAEQTVPAVTVLANGGFVVTWQDHSEIGGDSSETSIKAQIFDGLGAPVDTEFLVNTTTANFQTSPKITALANGGFVATWVDESALGRSQIRARIFNAAGVATGADFDVNSQSTAPDYYPAITAMPGGGFVAIWTDSSSDYAGGDGVGSNIKAQIFDASGGPVGGEFLVNDFIGQDQVKPVIAALGGNKLLAVWQDDRYAGQDHNGYAIMARMFIGGTAVGPEFLVRAIRPGNELNPVVTVLTNGGFVVSWQHRLDSAPIDSVVAQVFDAAGVALGHEIAVSQPGPAGYDAALGPTITALTNGGFVVSWTDSSQAAADQDGSAVFARTFNAAGVPDGDALQVNTTAQGDQSHPSIAALPKGGFVVAWGDVFGDTAVTANGSTIYSAGIKAQIFVVPLVAVDDAYIAPTDGVLVVAANFGVLANDSGPDPSTAFAASLVTGASHGTLVLHADGSFVYQPVSGYTGPDSFTYRANDGPLSATATVTINAKKLTKTGFDIAVDPAPSSAQQFPKVCGLNNGGFVVVWLDTSPAPPFDKTLKAQIFDASGHQIGADLRIDTVAMATVNGPSIVGLSGGGFVVAWDSSTAIGGNPGFLTIRTRVFDDAGVEIHAELQVNTVAPGDQYGPSVTGLANGGFVVAWNSFRGTGADASGLAIRAKLFDATGAAVSSEFLVNTHTASDQFAPKTTALSDGDFVATWLDTDPAGAFLNNVFLIRAQIFDAGGARRGGEFVVSTFVIYPRETLAVAGLKGGGFVASWVDETGAHGHAVIAAQVFDSTGGKVGAELTLSPASFDFQTAPGLASLSTGGFVVSWREEAYAGIGPRVQGREFTATGGSIGPNFTINTGAAGTLGAPAIAALAGGGAAVTWTDDSGPANSAVVKTRILAFQNHNTAPIAVGDAYNLLSGGTLAPIAAFGLLSNDDDANVTDRLTAALVTGPQHGSLTINSDGSFLYQARPGYVGADSFVYRASDGTDSATAKVTLTIGNNTRLGTEALANTITQGDQSRPSVTTLANGNYVVMWQDASSIGGDADSTAIKAQLFSAAGVKISTEFLVNNVTKGQQSAPKVAALPDGSFVAVWEDNSGLVGDADGFSIVARHFAADGSPEQDQIPINITTTGDQIRPSIAALTNNDYVVAWADGSGANFTIKARIFDPDFVRIRAEFAVSTATQTDQLDPSVIGLATGGFVVAWVNAVPVGAGASGSTIEAQIFDAAGAKVGAAFEVNMPTSRNQSQPAITALSNGGFVVSWTGFQSDSSGGGVRAQVFSATGAKIGADILVNTHTFSDQYAPAITSRSDGGFVITWTDGSLSGGDASGYAVKAQAFDASGVKLGREARVDVATAGDQYASAVASLSGDRFVVAFENAGGLGGDASGTAVNVQIFGVTTGVAEDGAIAGATIGYANGAGPSVTTDENGNFTLAGGTGPITLTGGVDTATGLAFTGTLEAPTGATIISPLTTLVEMAAEAHGDTGAAGIAAADALVIAALDLAAGTDLTTLDAVAAALAGDALAFRVGSEILDAVRLITAAGGSEPRAYAAILAALEGGSGSHRVDLTDRATLAMIGTGAGLSSAAADAVGVVVANTNLALSKLLNAPTNPLTAHDVFSAITGASIAQQGDAASMFAALGAGGDYVGAASLYSVSIDARLASDIAKAADKNVPCYCAGTMILTGRGEVAVNELVAGTLLVTAAGETKPIHWIGRRVVNCQGHPRPQSVWPVRIVAGAFGSVPVRDLFLSPDHAVFTEGALIPIKHLINDTTIVQEERDEVSYYHVELECHDVILAEGLPCESYLDTGNRSAFANGGPTVQLHPCFTRTAAGAWVHDACAPLIEDGPLLAAARDRLAARATELGHTPPVMLEIALDAGSARIQVPADVDAIRLLSPSCRQGSDARRLGALITGLRVDSVSLAMGDARLSSGFHEVEFHDTQAVRWTDGAATLLIGPAAAERLIEIDVHRVSSPATEKQAA